MFWSSIRNSETTGTRATCLSKRLNNGIGIDILPLEGCGDNYYLYKLRRLPLRIATVIYNTYVNDFNVSIKARLLRSLLRLFNIDYHGLYQWVERHNSAHPMSKYNKCTLTLCADPIVNTKEGDRRVIWDKKDFETTVMMPFEHIMIPVPVGYDHILQTEYHDYMTFPLVNQRKGKHDMIFEPDIPYKKYCSENYGVVYER